MDTPEEPDAHELTSLDDLPGDKLTPEPLASSQPIEDGIAFELDDPFEQESQPAEKDALDEKGFWNSDEMDEQMTAFGSYHLCRYGVCHSSPVLALLKRGKDQTRSLNHSTHGWARFFTVVMHGINDGPDVFRFDIRSQIRSRPDRF